MAEIFAANMAEIFAANMAEIFAANMVKIFAANMADDADRLNQKKESKNFGRIAPKIFFDVSGGALPPPGNLRGSGGLCPPRKLIFLWSNTFEYVRIRSNTFEYVFFTLNSLDVVVCTQLYLDALRCVRTYMPIIIMDIF